MKHITIVGHMSIGDDLVLIIEKNSKVTLSQVAQFANEHGSPIAVSKSYDGVIHYNRRI